MRNKEFIKVLKFVLFSISAGLIQIGSFAILESFTNLPYWPSYLISLILSILWNFTANRKFTFKDQSNVSVAMIKVLLFYLVFTPVSTILGDMADKALVNSYLILAITMISNFVLEYLYMTFVVFKKSKDEVDEQY
ncbi:GtrA family protein [Haploplasma modicum]|jgi:putative flippase GtrA|uniref:GtrA family protein n=1 Tax=Haploplasma modicum TaxID=2150 RepID=UPI0005584A4F|nr:GtrA family protein [Haploplasma modicum]MCR1809201.1 GtrA family protein [Haploplasma modicum]